ncbi:hypothetical protein [Bradyrhizobium sp. UFLA05-112]
MDTDNSATSDATAVPLGCAEDTVTRVEIRPPVLWRTVQWSGCVLMAVGSLYFAGLGISVLVHIDQGLATAMKLVSHASGTPFWALPMLLLALPFLSSSAIFGLIRMTQPFGFLEIRKNGLLLACYTLGPVSLSGSGDWFPWGFADWSNLASAGVFRLQGMRCMGLGLIDLEVFLASRKKLKREDLARRTRLGPHWAGITMNWMKVTSIGKFSEMIWSVRDVTVPKSSDEKDVLTWNQENYGFHIILVNRDIPCGAQALVDMIERARKAAIDRSTSDERIIQEHERRASLLPAPEARLHEIADLLNKGLISSEEYHRKRVEILSNV